MPCRSLMAVGVWCAQAVPLSAQIVSGLELGGAYVRYADSSSVTAMSLAPSLRLERPSATVLATGALSLLGSDRWSVQTALLATAFTPASGRLRGELAAVGGGSLHQAGAGVGYLTARVRGHLMGSVGGGWVGGGAGSTWDGGVWRSVVLGDVGGWARIGDATLAATVTPTSVGDSGAYADLETSVRWGRGPVELAVWLGGRSGGGGGGWGGVSATGWIARHIALTAGGGSYPADPTQSLAGGRYASVGLRLSSESRISRDAVTRSLRREVPPLARPIARSFEIRDAGGGRRTLRFRVPNARRVDLMGSFTNWEVVALSQAAPEIWEITLTVAPGISRMNIRVDEGPWGVPPGVAVLRDDFDGVVGVIVLP